MKEADCVNFLLLCKEQCATGNYQSGFYIIHSMHYSYNHSHLPTNACNTTFKTPTWLLGTKTCTSFKTCMQFVILLCRFVGKCDYQSDC